MDRKEFIVTVYSKGIKPVLIIIILFYCGKFLYNALFQSGEERFIMLFIFALGFIILTIYLIKQLFKTFIIKLNLVLPEYVKLWVRISLKIFEYISPIVLGAIFYHFWKQDSVSAASAIALILIQNILEIIKAEKMSAKTKIE